MATPQVKDFISDEEMVSLEKSSTPDFISDEEMGKLDPEPGMLSKVGSAVNDYAIQPLATAIDYTYAPIRQAAMAPVRIAKGEISDALLEPIKQLGRSPSEAPTSIQVAEAYGIPKEKNVSPIAVSNPMMASSYETNPLDDDSENEKVFPSAQAGMMMDLTFAPAIDKVAGLAGRKVTSLAQPLKSSSEALALKQSGAMLKDFRRAEGKGKVSQLGRAVLDEVVTLPTESGIKKQKLYRLGDNVEDVAYKANILKEDIGKQIGSVYQVIDDKITDPKVIDSLTGESIRKINETKRFDPAVDAPEIQRIIAEKFGKKIDGKKVISRVDDILEDIKLRGNSLTDAQELKREIDGKINYAKQTQDLPEIQQALIDIRNYIQTKTNSYVDVVSDAIKFEEGKKLKELNKRYASIAEISEMATDKASRNNANRMFSPTDYLSGAAGYATLGPKGVALAVGNKIARERGPGILASGGDAISDLLKSRQNLSPTIGNISVPINIQKNIQSETGPYLKMVAENKEEPKIKGYPESRTIPVNTIEIPRIEQMIHEKFQSNNIQKAKHLNLLRSSGRVVLDE